MIILKQLTLLNQYDTDKDQFIRLYSKFTGISQKKISIFLDTNNIRSLFEHPTAMEISKTQLNKVNQLKELRNLYHNLKSYDINYKFNTAERAGNYFKEFFAGMKDKERFVCSFLDNANNLITTKIMTTGTVDQSAVYPREIAKTAILYDAKSIIIAHNHPGGNPLPSKEDINVTNKINKGLSYLDIRLLDHVIVANNNYTSFLESGYPISSNSVAETLTCYDIKEKIINQYKKEFPQIKYISSSVANTINRINQEYGFLTVKDMKNKYSELGKKLEQHDDLSTSNKFKELQNVISDFKEAQMKERQSAAHEKSQQISKVHDMEI